MSDITSILRNSATNAATYATNAVNVLTTTSTPTKPAGPVTKNTATEKPAMWKVGLCALAAVGTLGAYFASRTGGEHPTSPQLNGSSSTDPIVSQFIAKYYPPKYSPTMENKPYTLGLVKIGKNATHIGAWINGQAHGYGEVMDRHGNRLDTAWNEGIPRPGVIVYANGGRYTGELECNATRVDQPHGKGKHFHACESDCKSTFDGIWEHGLREGSGTTTVFDGQKILGTYIRGELVEGELYDVKGLLKFSGSWKNKSPEKGIRLFEDGTWFSGLFKQKLRVSGTLYSKDREVLYTGKWINDKPAEWIPYILHLILRRY